MSDLFHKMRFHTRLSHQSHKLWLLAGTNLLVILLTACFSSAFWTLGNFLDLLSSASISGLMALGLLLVLLGGGLDISFTAVASLAQFVLALVLAKFDLGWSGSFLLVMTLGAALGCLNALLVHSLKTSAIVVTIALLNIYGGLLIWYSSGEMLYDFPLFFSDPGVFSLGGRPISLQVVVFVVAIPLTAALLHLNQFGRLIFASGGNRDAAARLGIPLLAISLFTYGLLGLFSGVAGLLQAQLVQAVTPGSLIGEELNVLAAVVLGGGSLAGGRGTVTGTLLGVLLVALIGNAMVLLGISPYWHKIATGAVLFISLALPALTSRFAPRVAL